MGRKEIQTRMARLDDLVESISYRSQLISRSQKLDSGIITTRRIGFLAGFLTAVVFVLIIPLIFWRLTGII
ncbi:hypothetical protein MmiEs2_15090 [Methanimicrococcus stummii]|uniref:Tetrahydromethanopterin S-methyltransferase F subunit domain-containing protein n=1 Tax=Methanimicrococcus stummii TaxID=3028294 RepID=A0AA96VCE8_9EURY|nr:tetrahydromethanopterin S-methyltransferase subunit F [Methanimicrococcus sp. Es2]WNY29283.1 hypothetical protein MmiEs2_15090 [Methanimicrococcus sp. Es2]